MTDRELLEKAAAAAEIKVEFYENDYGEIETVWNPLIDDGDAFRLAVKLQLSMDLFDDQILVGYTPNDNDCDQVEEISGDDPYAAARRAIVRAAALIGGSDGTKEMTMTDKTWQIVTRMPNGNEVSTVNIPWDQSRWETCVFYPNGSSDVVGVYFSQADAAQGHIETVQRMITV